jgi:hypothetical protein
MANYLNGVTKGLNSAVRDMAEKSNHTNPYQPDIALFLVIIPFISAINYYLTYTNIHLNGFLVLTFSIDTAQGYLAWWAVRSLILFLDKKWPYEKGPLKRIIFQIISTTFMGLAIISVLTELVSWLAKGKPAPLSFYAIDLFIIGIWFFVMNGIYIGLHYYNEWQRSEEKRREESLLKSGGIMVKQGKTDILLRFEELAGLFMEDDYVAATTLTGQKFFLGESLDKMEKKLPTLFFFRLNRQFIVHRQLVTGFRRTGNGKILVLLNKNQNIPAEIPVSRTKAVAFKPWFRPE